MKELKRKVSLEISEHALAEGGLLTSTTAAAAAVQQAAAVVFLVWIRTILLVFVMAGGTAFCWSE